MVRLVRCVKAFAVGATTVCLLPHIARGHDFIRETIPHIWVDAFIPEKLPPLEYASYDDELAKAQKQVFAGRYKLALITLQGIKEPKPDQAQDVALTRSRALHALGRDPEALSFLRTPALANNPDAQVLAAQVLSEQCKFDEALEALQAHLKATPASIPGRYWLARVNEQTGNLDAAEKAYAWFVDEPQSYLSRWGSRTFVREFESAEKVTTIAMAIDRWAQLNEKYRDNVKLHETILDMLVRSYDVLDRGYWPAKVAAAEYFMSHDQRKEAVEELKGDEESKVAGALDMNPNSAGAWRLLGLIAVDGFNFDTGDEAVAALRRVDAQSVQADLLEARNLLQQRRPQDAIKPVQRVLGRQPKNLEAMGLLAAVYALQLKEDEAANILKQVEAIDPDNATAYVEVAEQLGTMRQYPRAAEKYKTAISRAPWWTTPRNGLGLLYTQSGDEAAARNVLEDARKLDPFNLATTNYLRLLDDMATFAQKETDHFIVIYDPKEDPVIPEYFSDYMESVHAQICATFKHEPTLKTMIEVFPSHDAFSVRTTGSSWIPTVGASTGRVIALVSPRSGEQMGTFNWAQVLRHEYTHTVTLSATDNRIAHWMTEGLAVVEEHSPLRWDWVPMLYKAVKEKELFTLQDLTWAFVRPKKPHHRTLAYAESYWICQYIQEHWSHEKLLEMLEQFRKGGHQDDVFPAVLGKTIPQFEADFFAWTEQQVASWGYDPETTKKYDALREKAEEHLQARQYAEAAEAWEELAKLRPVDALPHQKLAFLYLPGRLNELDKAIAHLNALQKVELKDNRITKRIARLYRDNGKPKEAQKYALDAVYIAPYDLSAHELLAEIYEKNGETAGLEREKKTIPILQKWLAERKGDAGLKTVEN